MLRFLTAGESHGKGLVTIIDNFPSGVKIDSSFINEKLRARQSGYGRGARQKIESDQVEFLSGVRGGYTTGSPISIFIKNRDFENWKERMDAFKPLSEDAKIHIPRPGHADFAGSLKYGQDDIRNILERSSARETASRVAAGALFQLLLKNFGIEFSSAVLSIGGIGDEKIPELDLFDGKILKNISRSELRMPFPEAENEIKKNIDRIKKAGDTAGGIFIVQAKKVPPGLGSFTQWDEKLDGHIAMSLMSIQAIKSVEIGMGVKSASMKGSEFQDSIYSCGNKGFCRKSDNAGGIEGGVSNGENIIVKCAMKPIPTLMKPYLDTVDLKTGKPEKAFLERSDVCAVPAASVVGEAALAFSICLFFLKKFGGDSLKEISRNFEGYIKQLPGGK